MRRIAVQSQPKQVIQYPTEKKAGSGVQVVEHLPYPSKNLSSNPSITKKKMTTLAQPLPTISQTYHQLLKKTINLTLLL
jgi:hypothetical protein